MPYCERCKEEGPGFAPVRCKCGNELYCHNCANRCDGCGDAVCPKCTYAIPPGSDWHYACKDCTEEDV